jgi:hypothetical protein
MPLLLSRAPSGRLAISEFNPHRFQKGHDRGISSATTIAMISIAAQAQTISHEEVLAALPRLENLDSAESGGVPGLAIAVAYNDEVSERLWKARDRKAGSCRRRHGFCRSPPSKPISSTV